MFDPASSAITMALGNTHNLFVILSNVLLYRNTAWLGLGLGRYGQQ
jgi:hypothetical protein